MKLPFQTVQELEAIRADRVMGAGELARKAVGALGLLARYSKANNSLEFFEEFDFLGSMLFSVRPSMASVQKAVISLVRSVHEAGSEKSDLSFLRALTGRLVEEHREYYKASSGKASEAAAYKLKEFKCVLTHSKSRTVIDAITLWAEPGRSVIITESCPLKEGIDAAGLLARSDLTVTLITDAQLGLFIPKVEAVLVGADSVLGDGGVINKAGTFLIAMAAQRFGVPLYVVCESLKFQMSTKVQEPVLEEKDPKEIIVEDNPGFTVRNIYFDITPPELITGIFTEAGLLRPKEVLQIIRQEEKDYEFWIDRLMRLTQNNNSELNTPWLRNPPDEPVKY